MPHAIVVGSGAGGATVARELQGAFDVTVLEAGRAFRPLGMGLSTIERIKRAGLLLDEREMSLVFRALRVRKTADMVLVNGVGLGGTTTICTGNAARMDMDLRALGIDLDDAFAEIHREIPISTAHRERWRPPTRELFAICAGMGLDPQPMPKMGDAARCTGCGRCVLGCPRGAKWDSRRFLADARVRGARVETGCRVERVVIEGGRARGVVARRGWRRAFLPADLVVLAAGGLGTPAILERSGLPCAPRLFVDPVLCLATRVEGARQCREIPMPFVVRREGYILSPYFDYLSFLFNRSWRGPARDTLGLMIKLADTPAGRVTRRGVEKTLTPADRERLRGAVAEGQEILRRVGAREEEIVLGTLNAGHPGGALPLTAREAETLHHAHLPANLYVADATLLPAAEGLPPILTIVALAKAIARRIAGR